ncbi:glyoxalase superfamily protein [Jannaschia marina]|uniref:glyoxalase superfamily protein n=1 Tax=Jannaschia marina TaxID=2741674 RepID=UPI0015CE1629|nr:glyoxalase superfamily protein [Jannaschia marina]
MNTQPPSLIEAKEKAKQLRSKMSKSGSKIGHAQSLERVAHQHGFRDWNSMFAAIGKDRPMAWNVGDRVTGTYLSQRFSAHVTSVSALRPGWFKLVLQLEQAIDVVTSDAFSNQRRRIRGVVGPKAFSIERTSNGQPHLQIDVR